MAYFFLESLAIFITAQCVALEVINEPTCSKQPDSNRTLNLFINSRKDQDGEWVTTFLANKCDSHTTNITLDLTQKVYLCNGGEAVHLKGIIRTTKVGGHDRLMFHPNCGKNAAISNDGRSVQKIKLDDALNGVVLTHRPLRRNELFEVRLDKKHNKFKWSLGIGVTVYNPESMSVPDHMYNLKSGNWMMYHTFAHENGAVTIENYGANLNELQAAPLGSDAFAAASLRYRRCVDYLSSGSYPSIYLAWVALPGAINIAPASRALGVIGTQKPFHLDKVGDRVGVMVNSFGALHYFVNGVDQGPASSNMPLTLYGVFELYFNAAKGTIVDSSS